MKIVLLSCVIVAGLASVLVVPCSSGRPIASTEPPPTIPETAAEWRIEPTQAVVATPTWETLCDSAKTKANAKDFRGALVDFEAAAKAAPDQPRPLVGIAFTAIELKDRLRGTNALDKLLRIRPDLKDDKLVIQARQQLLALPTEDVPEAGPQATSRPAELQLTLQTIDQLLDDWHHATDADKAKGIASRARDLIDPVLLQEGLADLEAWSLAGRVALVQQDDDLAAFVFQSIKRLEPRYMNDASMTPLVVELNKRPLEGRVKGKSLYRWWLAYQLQKSASSCSLNQLKLVIMHKPDLGDFSWVSALGSSPHLAQHIEVARVLTQGGAHPNTSELVAILALRPDAYWHSANDAELVQLFLSTGTLARGLNIATLFTTKYFGDVEQQIVHALVNAGADINAPGENGWNLVS